jgi:tRNA (mo5U34)-methyltransferase
MNLRPDHLLDRFFGPDRPEGDITLDRCLNRIPRFQKKLEEIRSSIPDPGFAWYPYDSLVNFYVIHHLLASQGGSLTKLAGRGPIADLGCADGGVSFFLEWLGFQVHAGDNPTFNINRMRGLRLLKERLGSAVEIFESDFDGDFQAPQAHYDLALFLGVLYHLKNPYSALEKLAGKARRCILSTRVARKTPDGAIRFADHPMAYLLAEGETNNDVTNYWIFSETGLKRLLHRTGWEIEAWTTVGDEEGSDPVHADADERAYALLRSRLLTS